MKEFNRIWETIKDLIWLYNGGFKPLTSGNLKHETPGGLYFISSYVEGNIETFWIYRVFISLGKKMIFKKKLCNSLH